MKKDGKCNKQKLEKTLKMARIRRQRWGKQEEGRGGGRPKVAGADRKWVCVEERRGGGGGRDSGWREWEGG